LADIDIQHLANLTQLELSQQEISVVGEDLQRIMIMVDQMQAIDTSNVEPLAHPLDARQRLRPDQITETIERDLYQQGAPATADGLYLVPRVVE
jgi:aspartyl-tRNA(Asn)/glutamyl-tRNA(Gln) amidotransferase subunit C